MSLPDGEKEGGAGAYMGGSAPARGLQAYKGRRGDEQPSQPGPYSQFPSLQLHNLQEITTRRALRTAQLGVEHLEALKQVEHTIGHNSIPIEQVLVRSGRSDGTFRLPS